MVFAACMPVIHRSRALKLPSDQSRNELGDVFWLKLDERLDDWVIDGGDTLDHCVIDDGDTLHRLIDGDKLDRQLIDGGDALKEKEESRELKEESRESRRGSSPLVSAVDMRGSTAFP